MCCQRVRQPCAVVISLVTVFDRREVRRRQFRAPAQQAVGICMCRILTEVRAKVGRDYGRLHKTPHVAT